MFDTISSLQTAMFPGMWTYEIASKANDCFFHFHHRGYISGSVTSSVSEQDRLLKM